MDRLRIEAASSPVHMSNVLGRTFGRLDRIERSDLLTDAREYFDRAEQLRRAQINAPGSFGADRQAVLDDLVNGEIDHVSAVEKMADIARVADQRGAIPALLREASQRSIVRSWQLVKAHGDRLVLDLREQVDALVSESVTLADSMPSSVCDDESAVEFGTEAAGHWARLREIQTEWNTIHDLCDELRTSGGLPAADNEWPSYLDRIEYRTQSPDRMNASRFRHISGPLIIAEMQKEGMGPGIMTTEDVHTNRRVAEESRQGRTRSTAA